MNQLDSADLREVINEAKNLAIDCKHGSIHIDHLLVAMLTTGCVTPKYLVPLSVEDCQTWLSDLYPATSTATDDDSLPLSAEAERIIWHATWLAHQKKEQGANSLHLLLAILSYDNHAAEKAKQAGVIFEDIAAAHYKEPFPRKGPEVNRRRFKKPSALARFFRMAPPIDELGEELHLHAQELWQFQQYDDCIAVCQEGLGLMPAFDRLKILLADCYLGKKDYAHALPLFHELDKQYPDVWAYRYNLAYINDEIGDYQRSEEIITQMLAQYPNDPWVLNNRAFNLYRQGRYQEAIPFYEKAIEITPTWAYPWDNLGFVKYKLGFAEEALQLINKSLELDRGNSYAYMYKGKIYMEQGNNIRAMENFQQALRYRFTATYGYEVIELMKKYETPD
jgi:tetratricopeptide (TPR) repeat protein